MAVPPTAVSRGEGGRAPNSCLPRTVSVEEKQRNSQKNTPRSGANELFDILDGVKVSRFLKGENAGVRSPVISKLVFQMKTQVPKILFIILLAALRLVLGIHYFLNCTVCVYHQ